MLTHYRNQSYGELIELLKGDEITFSVLFAILRRRCTDIFTDHQNVIICYSNAPFPVWVWCKDTENADTVRDIVECITEYFPDIPIILSEKLRNELYKYGNFGGYETTVDMLSYKLDRLLPYSHNCDGKVMQADISQLDYLAQVWHDMSLEMEGYDHSHEYCVGHVGELIMNRSLFLWINDENRLVSLASRIDFGQYSRVSMVYTMPEHRRKGYASNLVGFLCERILADGLTPSLYTDGHYNASNECYRKIGFVQIGHLCTIKKI